MIAPNGKQLCTDKEVPLSESVLETVDLGKCLYYITVREGFMETMIRRPRKEAGGKDQNSQTLGLRFYF